MVLQLPSKDPQVPPDPVFSMYLCEPDFLHIFQQKQITQTKWKNRYETPAHLSLKTLKTFSEM